MSLFRLQSSLILLLLVVALQSGPCIADNQAPRPKLLGGTYANLQQYPIALVETSLLTCSGVLVGPHTILTAAHCVDPETSASDYVVSIGGAKYGVTVAYYNSAYDLEGSAEASNSRFDLGILLLTHDVRNIPPLPVLRDDPIRSGESAIVYGYGLTEKSDLTNFFNNGKFASVFITSVSEGMASSSLRRSKGAICSGDSGGPLVQNTLAGPAVVGISVTGTTSDDGDTCFPSDGGVSNYVDLQSTFAQNFLSNFRGVSYISGKLIHFQSLTQTLMNSLSDALSATQSKTFRTGLRRTDGQISKLLSYSDTKRRNLVQSFRADLQKALKEQNDARSKTFARKALVDLQKLIKLGVN